MSGRQSIVSRMLASAGIGSSAAVGAASAIVQADPSPAAPVAADPAPAAPAAGVTADDVNAAIQAAFAQGEASGRAAERTRTEAVLAAPQASSNLPTVALMLAHSDAGADVITAKIAALPQPAMLTAELISTAPAASTPLAVDLSETPVSSIGANAQDDDADDAASLWADARKANSPATTLTAGGTTLLKGC